MVTVAIIDYGMGNLFSVERACFASGMNGIITYSKDEILSADAVILPGVGAFGDAMATLERRDLISPIMDCVSRGTLVMGICLGLQLMMSESSEFGNHKGLGIIDGTVEKLIPCGSSDDCEKKICRHGAKVPHVGWSPIYRAGATGEIDPWKGSPLDGVRDGSHMYFVHSYCAKPNDQGVVLAFSEHGDERFCSAIKMDNIMAFQFHPERSGPPGIDIYRSINKMLIGNMEG